MSWGEQFQSETFLVVTHHRVGVFQQECAIADTALDAGIGRRTRIVGVPAFFAARTEQP